MGCAHSSGELQPREASASKDKGDVAAKQNLAPPPDMDPVNLGGFSSLLPVGGPLTAKEYRDRIQTSGGTREWVLPGTKCKVRWSFCSQRGYYPNSLDKPSQDAHCVHINFGGDPDCAFFGVFDGHGEHGTGCAEFARDQVPALLREDPDFKEAPHIAYYNAFMQANENMHASAVDDIMSGSTGITVLMRGRYIYVANVGDSRAVVSEAMPDGSVVARDLSSDQTPYRQDELQRVRACGAVVLTLDQLEGIKDPTIDCWTNELDDDGDPPRLWLPDNMFPGTAFTRSLGDGIAERIGVFAEPEVLIKRLTPRHRYIVIASDGVFEFMPSQKVVDVVSKFADLEEACVAVCSEAYRLWLCNETRTDDITIILLEISGLDDDGVEEEDVLITSPPGGVSGAIGHHSGSGTVFLPVDGNPSEESTVDLAALARPISKEEEDVLNQVALSNIVLADLTPEERAAVYSVVQKYDIKAGDAVISEGEPGTGFFIVKKGRLSVLMAPEPGAKTELVHTYVVEPGQEPPSFGEMGLLYSKPRAATVVAQTDGELLFLDRRALKAALSSMDLRETLAALRRVEALKPLMSCELQLVLDLMARRTFGAGEAICRQGDEGDAFYIILEGDVDCLVQEGAAEPRKVLSLSRHQHFGERSLAGPGKRAATVVARGPVVALEISRQVFEDAVGTLQAAVESSEQWRQGTASRTAVPRFQPRRDLSGLTVTPTSKVEQLWGSDRASVARVEYKGEGTSGAEGEAGSVLARITPLPSGVADHAARGVGVMSVVPDSAVVPAPARVVRDSRGLTELLDTEPLCTLAAVLAQGPLTEASAKYLAACVAVGLEDMHRSGVVYRAVAAETLVLTQSGMLQLVEPRHSKAISGRTYTFCGQPTYMAPEMVEMRGHTQAVDWWALGVLLYAILVGVTPFETAAEDELHLYYAILDSEVVVPGSVSPNARSAILDFLCRDPALRLGHGAMGLKRLKGHPFFAGTDWVAVATGTAVVPEELKRRLGELSGAVETTFQV